MFDIEGQEAMYDGMLIDPTIVINGKNGKDGVDGKDGAPGPEGLPGRDGVDGRDGKDGRDGIDGKDGISYWIEYDKKTNTLYFKNDGGKKSPDPIKLPSEAKGWGFAAGAGRGGVTAQADWNQKDPNAVDFIKNKPDLNTIQVTIMPEPIQEMLGLVLQYIGATGNGYEHGYFYECKEKDVSTITFDPSTISCDGDSFMSFVKTITPNYNDVVSGTMTYLADGDIWAFVGLDSNGDEVVTYQQYTLDFENFGFTFTGEFEDEDVVSFERTVEVTYAWDRIDVQPGAGRGRFLALWNCSTGLAESDPPESPYVYVTGDYFVVGTVSDTANRKPNGYAYNTGVPSTTAETEDVAIDDTYFFDGVNWKLQKTSKKPCDVTDVQVNGTSVVEDGVASIDLSGYETKSVIETLDATDSITLIDNKIYNGVEQTALTIALWDTPTVSSICEVVFTSGSTATTLSYPNTIKWLDGSDDVASNVFTPVANKRYTVMFYYDGSNTIATVKGVA